MSELRKLNESHKKAIEDLQSNCEHDPNDRPISVCVEVGVWGEGILCSLCGKILRWTEDPKRKYELVELY